MVYTTTSANTVIAMILSKTKMTDTAYADDILNWLKEAINLLRVRNSLKPMHKILSITDFSECLPCGLVALDAVVYNGKRLRLGLGVNDTRVQSMNLLRSQSISTYFSDTSDPAYSGNNQDYLLLRGDDVKFGSLSKSDDYYILHPNHIQTSFKEGQIILLYRALPTDDDGYPLIPDEPNFHLACFWYVMAWLAMTGYKHADPNMDYDYCDKKFEKYARRAKNRIKYPSVDKREALLQATVNLIPPRGYYEAFNINSEVPKFVNK